MKFIHLPGPGYVPLPLLAIWICASVYAYPPFQMPLAVEYVAFRPAIWEEEQVKEEIVEKRNQGGMVFIYYTNVSNQSVPLGEWYINDKESGFYRLSGDIAWDRRYASILKPGETSVLEICAVSEDFSSGKPLVFTQLNKNGRNVVYHTTEFREEQVHVSSIIFEKDLKTATIHLKNQTENRMDVQDIFFYGKKVKDRWISSEIIQPKGHIVIRLTLEKPYQAGELAVLQCNISSDDSFFSIFSHRNAYADYFPNGTWGIPEHMYEEARRHHLDTFVKGGTSSDTFFASDYKDTGFKAMPHTGLLPQVDMIRDLENHEAVACWYIHDEPDWLYHPQKVMAANQMTKQYSSRKPTLITLCRNAKFFEYAFIADIPCHDHYTVSAPSSSTWPYNYGTRLEETGYYTRDLKYAAAPKPIWVWTQGLHLWDERPKMPLPTPDEMAAQLYYNLGRGAKGNLWFTFHEEAGNRYPETKRAMQLYGRLINTLKDDLLLSDPLICKQTSHEYLDVAPLISPDKSILFVSNTQYEITDSAYQWTPLRNVEVEVQMPSWFKASNVYEFNPETGFQMIKWRQSKNALHLHFKSIRVGTIVVALSDHKQKENLIEKFQLAISHETIP